MDFMKVFDQTVRDIRREVNLKVLKVPEIEQKVFDATDSEPWGPHGSALSEIAQATKKFSECQMVMNVLWTRLKETDKGWRPVYKALTVIEYLVANGSERAVDDIIEHTFQISSLSTFEYAEPNGKDVGLNVRMKAETIVGLLNNKDKIQEARNKAAANRDKYVGLSSAGITYKSSSASSYGSSGFGSSDRYGGAGGTREGSFRDSYKDKEKYGKENTNKDIYRTSRKGTIRKNRAKESVHFDSKDEDTMLSSTSKSSAKLKDFDKYPQSSTAPTNNFDDEFDDFDPRGTSSTKAATGNSNQVDLFGDFMDVPTSLPVPSQESAMNSKSSEVDLFEDAAFVSAAPQVEKAKVDLFSSQTTRPCTVPITVQPETKTPKSDPTSTKIVDPFAAVPMNKFDGSDPFGDFTTNSNPVSPQPANHRPVKDHSLNNLSRNSSAYPKSSPKKDAFQVKSGIWADSLSRGLIDLNISAPQKASLAGVGIMGGLSDGYDERDRTPPPASLHMGRAMGAGTGLCLGKSGFSPSQGTSGDDFFSSLGNQPYQYGSFRK